MDVEGGWAETESAFGARWSTGFDGYDVVASDHCVEPLRCGWWRLGRVYNVRLCWVKVVAGDDGVWLFRLVTVCLLTCCCGLWLWGDVVSFGELGSSTVTGLPGFGLGLR